MRTRRAAVSWLVIAAAGAIILTGKAQAYGSEPSRLGGGRASSAAPSDPCTSLWYAHPADKCEDGFPVGN